MQKTHCINAKMMKRCYKNGAVCNICRQDISFNLRIVFNYLLYRLIQLVLSERKKIIDNKKKTWNLFIDWNGMSSKCYWKYFSEGGTVLKMLEYFGKENSLNLLTLKFRQHQSCWDLQRQNVENEFFHSTEKNNGKFKN